LPNGVLYMTDESRPGAGVMGGGVYKFIPDQPWSGGQPIRDLANSPLNSGRLFVQLKPKEQRPPLDTVISDLRRQLAPISGIDSYMVPVQNLVARATDVFMTEDFDRAGLWIGSPAAQ